MFNPLQLQLQILHPLFQHLVFVVQCLDLIDLALLDCQLFVLLLNDLTHVVQIVGSSNEPDLLEAEACNFQVRLVVTISLG